MVTQFSPEFESLCPNRASRLDGHRCESVVLVEGCILLLLAPLSQGCHCTCLSGGTCVRTGGIPHEEPTTPPGYQRDSIGMFAIGSGETSWFQPRRQMSCRHCAVDDVDSSVALVTALTPFAAKAMCGSAINLHTTVVTGVGVAKG